MEKEVDVLTAICKLYIIDISGYCKQVKATALWVMKIKFSGSFARDPKRAHAI